MRVLSVATCASLSILCSAAQAQENLL
ncbi:MAG: hypothetical protein RJA24_1444, partial [Pseudomonadota bacterium]